MMKVEVPEPNNVIRRGNRGVQIKPSYGSHGVAGLQGHKFFDPERATIDLQDEKDMKAFALVVNEIFPLGAWTIDADFNVGDIAHARIPAGIRFGSHRAMENALAKIRDAKSRI